MSSGRPSQVQVFRYIFRLAHLLRPVPTRPILSQATAIVGRFPSADSIGFKILNMFDRESRPTMTESVVESADSGIESADSTAVNLKNLKNVLNRPEGGNGITY